VPSQREQNQQQQQRTPLPAASAHRAPPRRPPESHDGDAGAAVVTAEIASGRRAGAQPVAASSRVVQRPHPRSQQQNPREYQLDQLRRRFGPEEEQTGVAAGGSSTTLLFGLKPSDPDFPYEMDALKCALSIPASWPASGRPTLRVTNKEMGRGFQINVERGFDQLCEASPSATLLQLLNLLDRHLEEYLSAPKAETIKLVPNAGRAPPPPQQQQRTPTGGAVSAIDGEAGPSAEPKKPAAPPPVVPSYTVEQTVAAQTKRDADTRQLEARLRRLPLYSKSSDGLVYTIPVDPRKKTELPVPLQVVKSVKLTVPTLYNLHPPRIELQGVLQGAARTSVESAFSERAAQQPDLTLMNHINYLTQEMHNMAQWGAKPVIEPQPVEIIPDLSALSVQDVAEKPSIKDWVLASSAAEDVDDDRSHIITIPRPPEWTVVAGADDDTNSEFSSEYDSNDSAEEDEEVGEATNQDKTGSLAERGILISFPSLELYGIELLELVTLSITVKCGRCKDTLDVSKVRNNTTGDYSGVRSESCKKCANPLGIGYRMDLMHANSVRAGYLDLDGCTVVDLLPRCVYVAALASSRPAVQSARVLKHRAAAPSSPRVALARRLTPRRVSSRCAVRRRWRFVGTVIVR